MELVIETNILVNLDNDIIDHQSRVIKVESWESYVEEVRNGEFVYRSSYIGNMYGSTFARETIPFNVEIDDYHGSCVVFHNDFKLKKLFYRVRENIK